MRWAAFFRNTTQSPLDGNISDPPPTLVVPRQEDRARWEQISEDESRLKDRMTKARSDSAADFAKWLDEEARPKIPGPVDPADEVFALSVHDLANATFKNRPLEIKLPDGTAIGEGHIKDRKALSFTGKASLELPNIDLFAADRPFTLSAWVLVPKGEDNYVIVSQTDPASKFRGWGLEIAGRRATLRISPQSNRTLSIRTGIGDRLKPDTWVHLAATYDGSRELAGFSLFVNGKSVMVEGRSDQENMKGDFRTYAPLRIANDGRRKYFDGGAISDLHLFTRALTEDEIGIVASWPLIENARPKQTAALSASEKEALHQYFLYREYGDYQGLVDQWQSLQDERRSIAKRGTVTHVQHERSGPALREHPVSRHVRSAAG